MISNPKHGWCSFKLGDFQGSPSYLTDVSVDLLDTFIDYHIKGYGVVVFDEEYSFFTLILTRYNCGIFIIEEKDNAILHDFSEMNIEQLEKELIADIENDLNGWTNFFTEDDWEEIVQHRREILQKIDILKKYIKS